MKYCVVRFPIHSMIFVLSFLMIMSTGSCTKGKGELVTQELELPTIEGIIFRTSDKVIIKQEAVQSITVVGQQNVIDLLTLDVDAGIWDIDFDRIIRSYDEMTIFISTPFISSIRLTGSGSVESDGEIDMQKGNLKIDGSGNIDVAVDVVEALTLNVNGSGNLIVTGSAMSTKVNIAGSGNLFSFGVDANDVNVNLSGSGNAEVFADDELNVNISGSGNVLYKGFPNVVVNITGSGNLVNAN